MFIAPRSFLSCLAPLVALQPGAWFHLALWNSALAGIIDASPPPLADDPIPPPAEDSGPGPSHLHRIALQKQYVPVTRNNVTIAYKTAYFGEVHAGSPRQTFTVVFDTGSGHFILPRTSCRSETCLKHRRYERKASSTAVDIEYDGKLLKPFATERDQVVVSFGTGKVTGEFVEDTVCFGPATSDCITLRLVLAVEMTPDPFGLFAFDGVLGLGLNALTLHPKFSFFGQMVAQNPGMLPQFSVFLSRYEDGESFITFGGHDPEVAASDIQWTPVAMEELGYWQVRIRSVRIGDTVLEDCAAGDCRAVLDTGTSLLGVPRQAARTMHSLLARPVPAEHAGDTSVDCRQVPGLTIDFELEGSVVSLPVEDYSRPAPFNLTTQANSSSASLICRSLLLPIDMKPPLGPKIFIWGEPVLRRYLTVYDLAKKQIGFSVARQPNAKSSALGGAAGTAIGVPPADSLVAGAPLRSASSPGGALRGGFPRPEASATAATTAPAAAVQI